MEQRRLLSDQVAGGPLRQLRLWLWSVAPGLSCWVPSSPPGLEAGLRLTDSCWQPLLSWSWPQP